MTYTYTLTPAERAAAMERLQRKASPARLWIQSVLLCVVAVGTVWGMLAQADTRTFGSYMLVAVCVALVPAQWLVARWFFAARAREDAADLAAQGRAQTLLEVLPGALRLGEGEESVLLPDAEWAGSKVHADMLLIQPGQTARGSVAIPRRVVGEDVWGQLMERNREE